VRPTAADVPEGFSLREATVDDADTIAALINDVNVAETGFPWTTTEEVRGDLTAPDRDPGNDVVLIEVTGALVGYLSVTVDAEDAMTFIQIAWVRPRDWGRGLSAWLLRLGEQRTSTLADGRAVVQVVCWATNEAARRLFSDLGYAPIRTFHQMRIGLTSPIEAVIPPGIDVRPFDPATDRLPTYAALSQAFADHWGRQLDPFEQWVHRHIDGAGADFDPDLWFVALDGREVVGAICTRPHLTSAPDTASVELLGVRRPWRGRGIARALLLTAFEAVRRREIGAIELGVDSTNPTGATQLYEGVGMHVVRSFEVWEKELPSVPV
jgi:mycothiol synthase